MPISDKKVINYHIEFTQNLINLSKKFPNDMDFGREVRKITDKSRFSNNTDHAI